MTRSERDQPTQTDLRMAATPEPAGASRNARPSDREVDGAAAETPG